MPGKRATAPVGEDVAAAKKRQLAFSGVDMWRGADGATHHLGAKEGEVHPRVLIVGTEARARSVAEAAFDPTPPYSSRTSSRNMTILSGYVGGVGVSVICIGMGAPMVDFMLRELSCVLPGPLAVLRLGTCGALSPAVRPGTVMVFSRGSIYTHNRYRYGVASGMAPSFGTGDYRSGLSDVVITEAEPCDAPLDALLQEELRRSCAAAEANGETSSGIPLVESLNCSGETFFACQGRTDPAFRDDVAEVVPELRRRGVGSVEMEAHQLFYLARRRRVKCAAAACAVVVVNRTAHEDFLTEEEAAEETTTNEGPTAKELRTNVTAATLQAAEVAAGKACVAALARWQRPTAVAAEGPCRATGAAELHGRAARTNGGAGAAEGDAGAETSLNEGGGRVAALPVAVNGG